MIPGRFGALDALRGVEGNARTGMIRMFRVFEPNPVSTKSIEPALLFITLAVNQAKFLHLGLKLCDLSLAYLIVTADYLELLHRPLLKRGHLFLHHLLTFLLFLLIRFLRFLGFQHVVAQLRLKLRCLQNVLGF